MLRSVLVGIVLSVMNSLSRNTLYSSPFQAMYLACTCNGMLCPLEVHTPQLPLYPQFLHCRFVCFCLIWGSIFLMSSYLYGSCFYVSPMALFSLLSTEASFRLYEFPLISREPSTFFSSNIHADTRQHSLHYFQYSESEAACIFASSTQRTFIYSPVDFFLFRI